MTVAYLVPGTRYLYLELLSGMIPGTGKRRWEYNLQSRNVIFHLDTENYTLASFSLGTCRLSVVLSLNCTIELDMRCSMLIPIAKKTRNFMSVYVTSI